MVFAWIRWIGYKNVHSVVLVGCEMRLLTGLLVGLLIVLSACTDVQSEPTTGSVSSESSANAGERSDVPQEAAASQTPEPTPHTALSERVSPTAEGPALEVLSHNEYTDLLGYMHIVGEVENTGSDTLTFVEVVASLYDAQGTLIGAESTYASLSILPPGQASPFHIISLGDASNVVTYKLQAQGDTSSFMVFNTEFIEVVSSSTFVDMLGYHHIVGEVANTTDETLVFVEIVATVYDADGEVVAADFTYASLDTMAPDSTSPFEVILLATAGEPADYRLVAQGTVR